MYKLNGSDVPVTLYAIDRIGDVLVYKQVGVETGRIVLHHGELEPGRTVVFKEHGHKYWASRGQQGYAPAEFHVCEVVSAPGPEGHAATRDGLRVVLKYSFPVTKKEGM